MCAGGSVRGKLVLQGGLTGTPAVLPPDTLPALSCGSAGTGLCQCLLGSCPRAEVLLLQPSQGSGTSLRGPWNFFIFTSTKHTGKAAQRCLGCGSPETHS